MKTCLICDHQETDRPHLQTDFVCSSCIRAITSTTQEMINERYIEALKDDNYKLAYGLYSFTSKKIRKRHPLPRRVARAVA